MEPFLSRDGAFLFFNNRNEPADETEGTPPFARIGIWLATRANPEAPFGAPVRIAAIDGFAEAATFSPECRAFYYHKRVGAAYVTWRVALRDDH